MDAKSPEPKAKLIQSLRTDEHMEQEAFQQSDYFREKSRHPYKIEGKNSELKNVN